MASNDRELIIDIGGERIYVAQTEDAPIAITYQIEDQEDFQTKQSSTALDITVPATLNNQRVANSFHNPNAEDLSGNDYYRNPRDASIIAAGVQVFKGKALMQSGAHSDMPEEYVFDFVGNNGDWMVLFAESTLWDFLPTTTHILDDTHQMATWAYDGYNSTETWVYAPVRYRKPFSVSDTNVDVVDLRPSLFVYWILRRAFDSIGYTLKSEFMDRTYFRRLVMPWVWGDFMGINSKLGELLRFKATGPASGLIPGTVSIYQEQPSGGTSGTEYIRLGVGGVLSTWQMDNASPTLGFDNNNNYFHNLSTGESFWTYKLANGVNFGQITGHFGVVTSGGVSADNSSNASIYIEVYKNGTLILTHTQYNASAGSFSSASDVQSNRVFNFNVSGLNINDTVSVRFKATWGIGGIGSGSIKLEATNHQSLGGGIFEDRFTSFELFGFSVEPGGTVDWTNYEQFKNYKFLDLLRGLVDCFDLICQTDPINQVVVFEPAHNYILDDGGGTVSKGYFKEDRLDWQGKQDLSQKSTNSLYSDRERELYFKFKGDSANGGVNIHNARYSIEAGTSKYLFSERFKKGEAAVTNRFFAAPMHYEAQQFKAITGIAPQLMAFIPENVSNTSADDSESLFVPVLAYYKGLVAPADYGGWSYNGSTAYDLPYMFAVNYKPGGQNDPILTYTDQDITANIGTVLGRGLMQRFFLPRLAITEYGKLYKTWMQLNNNDITNWMHREAIMINGATYHLIGIDRYKPLLPVPVECTFWKYIPPSDRNIDACYPSAASILTNPSTLATYDMRYARLLLLSTDIP